MTDSKIEDNFEVIRRETFERYLLDLLREVAYEEERLRFIQTGEPYPNEIRKIDFFEPGSAKSGFRVTFFEHKRGIETTAQHTLYDDPTFYKDGRRLQDAITIVSDILMRARGG